MAADYRHIGGLENRLGRHNSRFPPFSPTRPLQVNHLPCENCAMLPRIGEVRLEAARFVANLSAHTFCTIAGVRCLIDGAPTCCMAARVSWRRISRTRSTPG